MVRSVFCIHGRTPTPLTRLDHQRPARTGWSRYAAQMVSSVSKVHRRLLFIRAEAQITARRAGERCRLKLEADRANDAAPPASIQPQRQPESVATPPVGQAISIDALFGSVAPPANPEPPAPASDNLFEQFFGSRPSESSPVDQSKVRFPSGTSRCALNAAQVNMLDAIFASAAPQPASQVAALIFVYAVESQDRATARKSAFGQQCSV